MKAIFTDHALDNKNTPEMKWLFDDENAKRILNHYLDHSQEHFLIQNILPNFTFTNEYVFDNKNEKPAIYFQKNTLDRMKDFIKRTNKKDENFADFNFASIKVEIENELHTIKFYLRNGKNLASFYRFIAMAKKLNFLKNQSVIFFNRDISNDLYYTISGGLEKKYLLATIMDKFIFVCNDCLFINDCYFLTNDEKERINLQMQKVRNIDEIF